MSFEAYFFAALVVACVLFILLTAGTHAEHWVPPSWLENVLVRFGISWLLGFLWPALAAFGIYYFGGKFGAALWAWMLGDHNKVRHRPSALNAALYGDDSPGPAEVFTGLGETYRADGMLRHRRITLRT